MIEPAELPTELPDGARVADVAAREVSDAELAAAESTVRHGIGARITELLRFGMVGGLAFVIDAGLFNLLVFGPGEVLGTKQGTAKAISVTLATIFAWIGNRYWTFSEHKTQERGRELLGFVLVNVGGMAISVLCLWFGIHVLDQDSQLAQNIWANVIGLGLGTVFRYLMYRKFIFTGASSAAA
ncbi:GtrA family protein [Luteimicrobium subarcticum]|uniref:Putative flippase GtrA n=1 Tax=Luteimicrobium subarcticum TaxID=620910 RepID=A0A2M8WTE7_9MICO|nr:GtrA family protein [Luteimicrobium subarcticum]PJI94231.1 putative flippase GtrA [Luteimicrobium subarcticum]